MTIEFQVCPYHEPHPAGFERTLVVDTFTRRFKCAACSLSGRLLPDGAMLLDRITKTPEGDYATPFGVVDGGYAKHPLMQEDEENAQA